MEQIKSNISKNGNTRIVPNNNKKKHAGGRPKIVIDMAQVETLAEIFCTQEEISAIMGVSVDTLLRNKEFCDKYKKGIQKAKTNLRSVQFKLAQSNVVMAIWLGKQYLGQRDVIEEKQEQTITVLNDVPKRDNEQ